MKLMNNPVQSQFSLSKGWISNPQGLISSAASKRQSAGAVMISRSEPQRRGLSGNPVISTKKLPKLIESAVVPKQQGATDLDPPGRL
jgi:hypothetical protein